MTSLCKQTKTEYEQLRILKHEFAVAYEQAQLSGNGTEAKILKQKLQATFTDLNEKINASQNENWQKWLEIIYDKTKQKGELLTKYSLKFLYDVNLEQMDSRIDELLAGRDIKEDLSLIYNCSKNQISVTEEEALQGNIKYHYGNLDLSDLTSAQGLKLPTKSVNGVLNLDGLTSAEGLKLPEFVKRLDLNSLTSAQGLELPGSVKELGLDGLTSAKGLELPESVETLYLDGLISAQGLKLPESVKKLNLDSLISTEGLQLPEFVKELNLNSLTSAQGLELPGSVKILGLNSLTSIEGLKLPGSVEILGLNSLTSVEKTELRTKYPNIEIF